MLARCKSLVSQELHWGSTEMITEAHVSNGYGAMVTRLTLRLLMSYIYGAPILDVSRSHTATQHSR